MLPSLHCTIYQDFSGGQGGHWAAMVVVVGFFVCLLYGKGLFSFVNWCVFSPYIVCDAWMWTNSATQDGFPMQKKNDFPAVMIAAWKSQKNGNVMLSFVAGNDGEIPSLKLT